MTTYTTTVQRRDNPKATALAVQYKEISRRPAKFQDIVERNSGQIATLLKVSVNELTLPNGTKEGMPVLMARVPEGKIVMNLGDWLVIENKKFKVYKAEEFNTMYAHLV